MSRIRNHERARAFGRYMYHQDRMESRSLGTETFGAPRWMFRKLVTEGFKAVLRHLSVDEARSMAHRWEVAYLRGYISESRVQNRTRG